MCLYGYFLVEKIKNEQKIQFDKMPLAFSHLPLAIYPLYNPMNT